MTEAAWTRRVAETGDLEAFGALVRLHQGRLRAFLLRLTGCDHALADDLAQETFIEAHRKLAQYRGDGSFIGWLLQIAWTRFLMHRRGTKPAADIGDSAEEQAACDPALKLDLERALQRLSAVERAALTLCFAFGFHHAEAAKMLGIPLGTLKSHVSRGREKLRMMLGDVP